LTTRDELTHLAPSTIAYLYADQFVPPEQAGKVGQVSWNSGRVVHTQTLAVRLGMAALFGLRAGGSITLTPYAEKKLLITMRGVRAVVVGDLPKLGGVEKAVIEEIADHRKGRAQGVDVNYVFSIIAREGKNPYGVIVRHAMDDAVAHGYLMRESVERGVRDHLRGAAGSKLTPIPDRIAELRPQCEEFVEMWNRVHDDERALFDETQRVILAALRARDHSQGDD
jgi:hypothetical protein